MFSFVLLDESVAPSRIIAARDPIGITTLYQGWSSKRPGTVYFASELKALVNDCDKIISFPPGHVYDSQDQSTTRYYTPSWWNGDLDGDAANIPTTKADLELIRTTLEDAVRKRLMSEVPYGVLLSGGLDSSLIASIAARETEKVAQAQYELRQKKLKELSSGPSTPTLASELSKSNDLSIPSVHLNLIFPATLVAWPQLHSFSIGLENSPDLIAARKAAHFLGTVHHEYVFTVQEGIDAIPEVIYHLETFDVTTVRASTPMYLLSRKIKAMGVKMVLSGEGSDEILGGWSSINGCTDNLLMDSQVISTSTLHRMQNHSIKNALSGSRTSIPPTACELTSKFACFVLDIALIHLVSIPFRSTMAWGLEARVPFLDKQFLEVAMNVDPKEKMFSKGSSQEVDEDGRPKMEKVKISFHQCYQVSPALFSTFSGKHLTVRQTER